MAALRSRWWRNSSRGLTPASSKRTLKRYALQLVSERSHRNGVSSPFAAFGPLVLRQESRPDHPITVLEAIMGRRFDTRKQIKSRLIIRKTPMENPEFYSELELVLRGQAKLALLPPPSDIV